MKIAVIGGAGVRTVIFINGLLKRYKKLQIDEVALYDIDKEKLGIIEKLCQYAVKRKGEELKVYALQSPLEAIRGAHYIVTTLRVGGDHSRVLDEECALDLNLIGQETTGAGGFFMALRTIPVLKEYCELIKKEAPHAWIFNFTNPSGLVTQALTRMGYKNIIGICDAPSSTKFRMAKELGIEEENLYLEFFGLNHLSWIRSARVDGKEVLANLLADDDFLDRVQEFSLFDRDLLKLIGLLPNEYLYYYYHRERALSNIKASGESRGKAIEKINLQMMEALKNTDIDKNPQEALQIFLYYMQVRENSYMSIESATKERPLLAMGELEIPDGMGYAGVMLDCIEGMQSDKGKDLILSVKNQGSIPFLQDDDVVEMTCHVSKEGIIPVKVAEVPKDCEMLIRLIKRYENLTVDAILKGSRELALSALMLHPLVNSYSLAKALLEKYQKLYGDIFDKGGDK